MAAINAELNLVLPLRFAERVVEEGGQKKTVSEAILNAYHTPISREFFELNYRVIAAAKSELFAGLAHQDRRRMAQALADAAKVAALALKDAAAADALDRGGDTEGVAPGAALLGEIKRLTWILAPGKAGYDMLPVDVAVQRGVIDPDEWLEVESSIVFFTCGLSMARRTGRREAAEFTALILGGSITSSKPLEWAASSSGSTTDAILSGTVEGPMSATVTAGVGAALLSVPS